MSAGFFSNVTCQTSPYIMNNEHLSHKNSSDHFNQILPTLNNSSTCIRRTLSADMSSPKWLENNGFNLKKVQSSHQLQALGEEHHHGNSKNDHDHNKGPAFEDIWSSIQADKRSWGSILSPTKNDGSGSGSGSGQVPAPYIHPLAKRRASSLSEKSLEICTESLGSETGSDGFSYSSSEPEDSDKEHEHEAEEEKEMEKEQPEMVVEVKEYNNFGNASQMGNHKYNSKCNSYRGPTTKRSMMVPNGRPSFPPPLPSFANRNDGSNLHIRSHRQDGRLVVEAVSVPSQNCFRAQRQDGRLLLTLTAATDEQEQDEVVNDDNDEVVSEDEDGEKGKDEELGEQKTGIVMLDDYVNEVGEEELEVINVQRSCPTLTMTMSKLLNKSTWPRDYNKNVIKTLDDVDEDVVDDEEDEIQSLLSQSGVSTATASLNGYEYYWRRNNSNTPTPTAVAVLNQLTGQQYNNNNINNIYADAPQVEKDNSKGNKNKHLLFAAHNTKGVALAQQEVVLVKAAGRRGGTASTQEKGEYLVPFMLRGCKDHNKSFFLLDPYCIATS